MRLSRVLNRILISLVAALVLSACATGPAGKNESRGPANASERAQAYLNGVEFATASEKNAGAKTCKFSPEQEKRAPARVGAPSKDWQGVVAIANACVQAKDWKTLEAVAQQISRADVDSPWGAYFLGLAAEGRKDHARAMWMVDLAQKKSAGKSGLFAFQKGRLLLAVGETSRAMVEFESAVKLDPRLTEAQVYLGEIHLRDQEFELAGPYYQAALKNHPKHLKALLGLAEVKFQKGSGDEAADLYARVLEIQPDHLKSWLRLAHAQETMQKNSVQALSTYRGLKTSIDRGGVKDRPTFDLAAKIKALEDATRPRAPAQSAMAPTSSEKKTDKK